VGINVGLPSTVVSKLLEPSILVQWITGMGRCKYRCYCAHFHVDFRVVDIVIMRIVEEAFGIGINGRDEMR
jgi:hypothetical protein